MKISGIGFVGGGVAILLLELTDPGNAGYAVFGRVIAGMEVVDHIATIQTRSVDVPGVTDGSMENVPVEPIIIRKVQRSK